MGQEPGQSQSAKDDSETNGLVSNLRMSPRGEGGEGRVRNE